MRHLHADSLEPRRLLSTTLVYETHEETEEGYSTYSSTGASHDYEPGWGLYNNVNDGYGAWGYFDPSSWHASSLTLDLSDLPTHTMLLVSLGHTPGFYPVDTDVDTFRVEVDNRSFDEVQTETSYTDDGVSGLWLAHSESSVTITFSAIGIEAPEEDWIDINSVKVFVYNPTVSVTGSGTTSEDTETPMNVALTRDLPNAVFWGGNRAHNSAIDDAVPSTVAKIATTGSATSGTDYTSTVPSTDITIASGTSSSTFSVTPKFDNAAEADETVVLTPTATSGYPVNIGSSANITIEDAGEMTMETLVETLQDPTDEHDAFAFTGSTASTGFRVNIETLDVNDDPIASTGVTDQIYTITVTGPATLSSVTDSLAVGTWSIATGGKSATLTITGPVTAQSLDISVALTATGTGTVEVELEATAVRGLATFDSGRKSFGRKIDNVATPGALETSLRIYHLIDDDTAAGGGHSAALISDDAGGLTYYSYDAKGNLDTQHYNNIADALAGAKAGGYDRYQYWITAQHLDDARAAALGFHNTSYNLFSHNCWDMVCAVLSAGQTNADVSGWVPKSMFNTNLGNVDGFGDL